jgi:hypothetical protein
LPLATAIAAALERAALSTEEIAAVFRAAEDGAQALESEDERAPATLGSR